MLVKILGVIDVIGALILLFGTGTKLPTFISMFFGVVLIIKACLGMFSDFGSWIDLIGAIVFFLSYFFILPTFILIIAGVLLIQKGIFSFL
jgi:hypothetical protein